MREPRHCIEDYDFKTAYKTESNAPLRIRLLGMIHLQEGRSPPEVAELLKVRKQSVYNWIHRFHAAGIDGLRDQPGRGRKTRLPDAALQQLPDRIAALEEQRSGGRVTGENIRQMIEQAFSVTYSISGIYSLLKRRKLVWITGRSRHPKGDPKQQQAFKKTSPNT